MATAIRLIEDLEADFDRAVNLLDSIRALRFPPAAGHTFPALPNFQVALVAELAYLRCFLAWEVFLEEVFVCYALGKPAPNGTTFETYVAPPNEAHARGMITGEGRAFVSWNRPKAVRERAQLFFREGEPFSPALLTISTILSDMIVVRNRIAHRSTSARAKFLDLVRLRLGSVPPGISPGRFLLAPGVTPTLRRIDEYLTELRVVARQIAPR